MVDVIIVVIVVIVVFVVIVVLSFLVVRVGWIVGDLQVVNAEVFVA